MTGRGGADGPGRAPVVPLRTIAREWGRIGCIGFGGPPAHIALLRKLCVDERCWLSAEAFEDGVAVTNLLPGPASTQLAILSAWLLRGPPGAVVGGLCFIIPGLALILALAALFLAPSPPLAITAAAAGAGAAVPVVALQAAWLLVPASRKRARADGGGGIRWFLYVLAGGLSAATLGPWLVLVIAGAGLVELAVRAAPSPRTGQRGAGLIAAGTVPAVVSGGLAALAWVAFKVGALSYGGGFVIVPLMQHDAVRTYHWMTDSQFLSAVALGQVTPGPVVHTVAVVGYAAGGVGGGLLAALCAFGPSFAFVLAGGSRFDRLRRNTRAQSFLTGAGAAAVGAIAGSSIPLGRALSQPWQAGVLALAALWLLVFRRGVVSALVAAGLLGVLAVASGAAA
jgi:chromate transporter